MCAHRGAELALSAWRSLGEGANGCVVDVGDKAGAVIEELVAAGVVALEVLFPEWHSVWPLWVL